MAYLEIAGTGSYDYTPGTYEGTRFSVDDSEKITELAFERNAASLVITGKLDGVAFSFTITNYPFTAETLDSLNTLVYGLTDGAIGTYGTIADNYNINYSAAADFAKSDIGSLYKWNVTPTADIDVIGLGANDKLNVDGAVLKRTDESDVLVIDGTTYDVTVSNFGFDGSKNFLLNGSSTAGLEIQVTLTDALLTAYVATNYHEIFQGTGSVTGFSTANDMVYAADPANAVLTRTNNGDITVNGGITVDTGNTAFTITDNAATPTTQTSTGLGLAVTLTDDLGATPYTALANYAETVTLGLTDLASVTVTGLAEGDNLAVGAGYSLSGLASNLENLVVTTAGNKVVNVTVASFKNLPAFHIAGAAVAAGAALAVTADADYAASNNYTETITMSGAHELSGLAAADTVKLPGALSVCTYDGTEVVLGDGTNSATLALADMTTQFGINANNAVVDRAATVMTVTGDSAFDATTNVYGFRYDITAVDDAENTLIGGAYADTITGGNTASTLKGGAGVDTITAGTAGDSIYGGTGNDILTGGTGADKFYFANGDGADTIDTYDETDTIFFTDVNAEDVTVAKSGDDLVLTYGANTVTVTDYNFAKTEAGAIDTITCADGTFTIASKLAPIDIVLADGATHTCSIYDENISVVADGTATVNGIKASDNLDMGAGYSLSGLASNLENLVVTSADERVLNVTVASFKNLPAFNIAGAAVAAGAALAVEADADYAASNNYTETITVTQVCNLSNLGADDNVVVVADTFAKSGDNLSIVNGGIEKATVTDIGTNHTFNINGAELSTLTLSVEAENFDASAGYWGFGRFNITGTSEEEGAAGTLKGYTGADTITAGDAGDNLYGMAGNDTLYNGAGADKFYFADGDGNDTIATYDENDTIHFTNVNADDVTVTKAGANLVLAYGANTVTVTGYDFEKTTAGAIDTITCADGTFTIASKLAPIDIVLANGDNHTCSIYDENISLTSGTATVNGIKASDNLAMGAGYTLARKASAATVLEVTNNNKTIKVTGYDFTEAVADVFTVAGVALTTDLAVTADADYAASDIFAETVTISGTGRNIENLKAADTLIAGGASVFARDAAAAATLVIINGEEAVLANVTDYATNRAFTLNDGTANVDVANETLVVTGFSEFDATTAADGWGFGTFDITGTDDNDALAGAAGNDFIDGGAGNDTLTGNGGADTFVVGAGDDTITDATSADIIKFVVNSETTFEGITFVQDGTSLMATYGDTWSVEIENYFDAEGAVMPDVVNTFVLSSAHGDATYTLEWHESAIDDYEGMYLVQTDKGNTISVLGIPNWINSGAANDHIGGGNAYDMLAGNAGDDSIQTTVPFTEIYGQAGNDEIIARGGDSIIVGGAGNDTITVEGGSNTIAFTEAEFGADTLTGATSTDTLKFAEDNGAGHDFDNLTFTRVGNQLVISDFLDENNSVTVDEFFNTEFRVDDVLAADNFGAQAEFSVFEDATIDVDLNGFGNVYEGTGYAENFIVDPANESIVTNSDYRDSIEINALGIEYDNLTFDKLKDGSLVIVNNTDPENPQNILTLDGYFRQKADERIKDLWVGGQLYEIQYFPPENTYDSDDVQAAGGVIVIPKGTGDVEVNAEDYVSTSTKGIQVYNKSFSGDTDVTGSDYNDRITLKGGNNTIQEEAGTNKIKTGKGDDVIVAEGISSNNINAGAGANTILLNSVGSNHVVTGKGADILSISDGANRARLGSGNNEVFIDGGVNTVITGKNNDTFVINGGNNIIKSGSASSAYDPLTGQGADQFIITDGANSIKSNGYSYYEIAGGVNTVSTGKKNDIFDIDGGTNIISSGKGNDEFMITDGINTINAGKGNDNITLLGGMSLVNGGKGNDTYTVDMTVGGFDFETGTILISDTSGVNTLDLAMDGGDQLYVFFDVEVQHKKGRTIGAYSDMTFTTDDGAGFANFDDAEGIDVASGKSISTVVINGAETYNVSARDFSALAQQVAAWLEENNYASTADVFDNGDAGEIADMLAFYQDFSDAHFTNV